MPYVPCLLALRLLSVAPAVAAEPTPAAPAPSLTHSIRVQVARVAMDEPGQPRGVAGPTARPKRNWVQRHPVATTAMAGAAAGFVIGYLPGDDGVFYDFTAGFNGTVLAGVGAGAGASLVATVQALRR